MQASLTDRVREGVSVSALSVALTQALALARSVVLARLLAAGLASTAAILLLLLSSQPQLRAEASGFGSWLLGHLPAREKRMRRHAD